MLVTDILAGGLCVVWLENLRDGFLNTVSFTACESLVKIAIFWSKVDLKSFVLVLVTRFINNVYFVQ